MAIPGPSQLFLDALVSEGGRSKACDFKIDSGFHPTPLGRCLLGETRGRVCYLAFAPDGADRAMLSDLTRRWPGASLSHNQKQTGSTVRRIFAEEGEGGAEIKLLVRGTRFQVDVWRALVRLPIGSVLSYAEVAQKIGRAKATRAVASAIGANPIAWLIPCHRVIRSDGRLGGYRWGIAMKQACLELEKRWLESLTTSPPGSGSAK